MSNIIYTLWYNIVIAKIMFLTIIKLRNRKYMFVSKSVRVGGTSKRYNVENLGSIDSIMQEKGFLSENEAIEWGKQYTEELNKKIKTENEEISIKYFPNRIRAVGDKARKCQIGYLILQKIYYTLGLNLICDNIQKRNKVTYNLNTIMESLVYARILSPASKLRTSEEVANYYKWNSLVPHQVYRSLSVFAKEMDYFQSQLYENSLKVINRDTTVLYYDCTNFFFETEQSEWLKQYGYSMEHRPNPIVQMGLFMDRNGYPLAFCIDEGNTSETQTMIPLEKKILDKHDLDEIIICTDAAMAIADNKIFNSAGTRHFVTTQPIKKLSKFYTEWALDPQGWKKYIPSREGETEEEATFRRQQIAKQKTYNINEINEEAEKDSIFFKKIGFLQDIKDNGTAVNVEQTLYVTYSVRYKRYTQMKRAEHIKKAESAIKNSSKIESHNNRDYKRFIGKQSCTKEGELAEITEYFIDQSVIDNEARYDGFYGVATDMDKNVDKVLTVLKDKWEIEESFRIMKTDFEARPVYVSRDDRIKAHFLTCYLTLFIYRVLEKHYMREMYSSDEIIRTLREMDAAIIESPISDQCGVSPLFEYTKCCQALFFHTDVMLNKEYLLDKELSKIIKQNKKTPEKVQRLFNPDRRAVGRPSKASLLEKEKNVSTKQVKRTKK